MNQKVDRNVEVAEGVVIPAGSWIEVLEEKTYKKTTLAGTKVEVNHVAEYLCERLPVYSNTPVKGQEKTIHIWENPNESRPHLKWWISVEKGKLFHFSKGPHHASLEEFKFEGLSNKPQRWKKV